MYRTLVRANPSVYLKNLIATQGFSAHHATEYYNAHVSFDPEEHAHSDTYDDTHSLLRQWLEEDNTEGYGKLVHHVTHSDVISHSFKLQNYFGMGGVAIHFFGTKGGDGRMTVTFPVVDASRVDVDVEIFSHISRHIGRLLETKRNHVHFSICTAFLRWEDMEEEGILYAEVDSD
jgi:hypothetical protein